jgi:isoaspartyl peptidase/L-asparaginase-like protein (Ntn-hydrolase superfamily)
MLTGEGAEIWAEDHGISLIPNEELITLETSAKFQENAKTREKKRKQPEKEEENRLDTIGCVCIDQQGKFVSTVSSGGISFKHPGRTGEASLFGQNSFNK